MKVPQTLEIDKKEMMMMISCWL